MGIARILVVDDQPYERDSICALLEGEGYVVKGVSSGMEALQQLKRGSFHVVVTDLKMAGMAGNVVTRKVREISPRTEVIVVTAYGEIKSAVESMRCGAFDYITKGATLPEELLDCVKRALRAVDAHPKTDEVLLERTPGAAPRVKIVGESPSIREVIRLAGLAAERAGRDCPVLILGESGTGKELVARMIHEWEPRRKGPFIAVNCAAISDSLAESELFGIEEGVATGVRRRTGKFEQADGGTLFLDEIGDLKPELQAKLLRVTQEFEFERVGGAKPVHVDLQIISATSVDLRQAIREGSFKEALLHRLNVIEIRLPALRERREDIPQLVEHFLKRHASTSLKELSQEALTRIMAYDWPGNVRQLEKVILRALILSKGGTIREEHLPDEVLRPAPPARSDPMASLPDVERNLIIRVIAETQGNLHEAARRLKISRPTLYSKMKRFGIDRPPS
ncbi:MAG: sigma-54-dependent Fis family transcriptional regulator [Nitrospirae bacterium]|nr:sigma-54-dependent Fis family transcriptional regulator [Nitrospirota bacterium]